MDLEYQEGMTHREAMNALDKRYPGLTKPYTRVFRNNGIDIPPKLIVTTDIPAGSACAYDREDEILLSPERITYGTAPALMGVIGHEAGHILAEHGLKWVESLQYDPRSTDEKIRAREEEADRLAAYIVGKDAIRECHRWGRRIRLPQELTFDQARKHVKSCDSYRGTTRQRAANLNSVNLEDRGHFEALVEARNSRIKNWVVE